jgi:hypothetical protein
MPSGQQTTTTTQKPPGFQSRLFKQAGADAMRLYGRGGGMNTGSMVVPFSNQTTQAQKGIMDMAGANTDGGMNPQLQGIINNGGFNDQQMGALNNWQDTANGSYDFNANPGSQGVLDSILRDTRNNVNGLAAGAGRYGGGMHQGRMAQDVGDISSQYRSNDYNSWLGRRDSANQNVFNGAQAGLGNMQNAYQGMKQPFSDMMGVGAMNEDLRRRQLDDRARMVNQPWEQISRLQAVGSGMGSYGTTTATGPGPNPFLQALGMGATAGNFLFGSQPGGVMGMLGGGGGNPVGMSG